MTPMMHHLLSEENLALYEQHLLLVDKSPATMEKYLHAVRVFAGGVHGEAIKTDGKRPAAA